MKKIIYKLTPNFIKTKWKKYKFTKKIKEIIDNINRQKDGKVIFLFNTPFHGNLGDHAIACSEYEYLKDSFDYPIIEILYDYIIDDKIFSEIAKCVNLDDLIFIQGGGYMGDIWLEEEYNVRKVISAFKNQKIAIFPQTIYYSDTPEGKKHLDDSLDVYKDNENLCICVREEKSYELVKKMYGATKVLLIPDMVLYSKLNNKKKIRNDILFLVRCDKEKKHNTDEYVNIVKENDKELSLVLSDTVIPREIPLEDREEQIEEMFDKCRGAKIIVTDRLHGMIFAALTETPCVVMSNFNYKVLGVYQWIKHLEYIKFVENVNEFLPAYNSLIKDNKKYKYDNVDLKKNFDKLTEFYKLEKID